MSLSFPLLPAAHRPHVGRAVLVTCLLVSGCTVGPDYEAPVSTTTLPDRFVNTEPNPAAAVTAGEMRPWWQRIEDPAFIADVEVLLRDNLSLIAATERVSQAEERLVIQQGGQRPNVSVDGSAGRGFNPNPVGPAPERIYADTYAADLNVGWTVDLFGRIRRSLEAGRGLCGHGSGSRSARSPLIASLANRRVGVAVNQRLFDLANQNTTNRELLYELVKRRYDLGARGTQLSDVYLAEDSVTSRPCRGGRNSSGCSRMGGYPPRRAAQSAARGDAGGDEFPLLAPPPAAPPCRPSCWTGDRICGPPICGLVPPMPTSGSRWPTSILNSKSSAASADRPRRSITCFPPSA